MGFDELLSAIAGQKSITDHPDWPRIREHPLPRFVSFYYTNQNGEEAYWDMARIIKLDLNRMVLVIEGAHGDPLNFDIFKIVHCKNAQTGDKAIQDLFFELIRIWRETYDPV